MNERIHRYLDGELPADALTAAELDRARELDLALERAAAGLRAAPAPDLAARVMAALPAAAPRRAPWHAALAWLWSPRPVRLAFRPAYGLAACGLAAAALALPAGGGVEAPAAVVADAPAAAPDAAPIVYVQFRIQAAEAREVAVAGTFTGWRPTLPLQRTGDGTWTALVPLEPGVHDYVFVIDGAEWVPDPHAAQQVDDQFGGTNSRISLPPPGASV